MKYLKTLQINVIILLIISNHFANAYQIHSIYDGCWDNAKNWNAGLIPSYDDTIYIQNNIVFNRPIYLRNGVISVDSVGSLTGLFNINIPCLSAIYNYGTIKCQSIDVEGKLINYNTLLCKKSSHIANCDTFINMGLFQLDGGIDLPHSDECPYNANIQISVFGTKNISVKFVLTAPTNIEIFICDISGRIIYTQTTFYSLPDIYIIQPELPNSISKQFYLIKVQTDGSKVTKIAMLSD